MGRRTNRHPGTHHQATLNAIHYPSHLETRFAKLWKRNGGPPLATEFQFDDSRNWRFDFAHPATRTAIEIEGGIWQAGEQLKRGKSRHFDGAGAVKDMQKYFAATIAHWTVFRLCGPLITEEYVIPIIHHIAYREKFGG